MSTLNRKVTYRLYPSIKQKNRMKEYLCLHQRLYNAGLEERIDAYKKCKIKIKFKDQCKSLTLVREQNPEYAIINAQSQQVTLKRLDLAFAYFFRRVKEGKKKLGFPRFKSLDRYKGWGYKSHGDGWKFKPGKDFKNGTLSISGIGSVQVRGRARYRDKEKTDRNPGIPKTMEILKRGDLWFASITFRISTPFRSSGTEAMGLDWGTSRFMTIVNPDQKIEVIENPRYWNQAKEQVIKTQQELSRKKKGSKNREKTKEKLNRHHRRLRWKRENFLHQTSAEIIKKVGLLGVEDLDIQKMTSGGGKYKSGLNRSILDTAPGLFFQLLEYKAEEAGIFYVKAPTRKLKPSQTCYRCHNQEKKKLSERVHTCKKCGLTCDRDVNAAHVILEYALKESGQELALGVEGKQEECLASFLKHETLPIPEAAFSS